MRILIDIGHPAHVHMYHYFAKEMQSRGHEVLFVCRDKEFTVQLLTGFGFPFVNLGRKSDSLLGKAWNTFRFTLRELHIARRFHADIFVSHGSIIAAQTARLMHCPHISFEDTFNAEQVNLYVPLTQVVFTADYDNPLAGRQNVLRYAGYKELLYLHPAHFTPDTNGIRRELGLCEGERFSIVRFVGWNATHDKGHPGMSDANKRLAVETLSRYGRVFISSEAALPADLEAYRFTLPPERMHDAEAAASLIFGESSTMVAEGAVLGTPGIYIDNTGRLYTADIEHRYGLCHCFTESETDQRLAIAAAERILSGAEGIDYAERRQQLLREKIDVTALFCWMVEHYPYSAEIYRQNRKGVEQMLREGWGNWPETNGGSLTTQVYTGKRKHILIDINHPAHVHLLRNAYFELIRRGHQVHVLVKDIPSAKQLMDLYGIPYTQIGEKNDSLVKKGLDQIAYDWRIWLYVVRHHIDLGVGTSINLAHVSRLSRMKSVILDDDDDAVEPLFAKYAHPFANVILSPKGTARCSKRVVYHPSFHELAYLHPNRFAPDPSVLDDAGVKYEKTATGEIHVLEPYFVLRFNAFKAHHDAGAIGLTIENKRKLVKMLSAVGKVFITTERNIDDEFLPYQLHVSPEKAHSLIYYATMLVGDSQTMTSEAAVLGTPAIRCNTFVGRIHYLEEEEHAYGLTYGFRPDESEQMFEKIEELLSMGPDNLKKEWATRRQRLLADKIDYTAFQVWFIENYPMSVKEAQNADAAWWQQFK